MARGRMDWILFFTVLAMVAFGLVMVFSASSVIAPLRYKEESTYFIVRQFLAALLGFGAMVIFMLQDYRKFFSPSKAFMGLGITLVLLLAAYLLDARNHRWIHLGFTNFQPSELAKPALIVFIAWVASTRTGTVNSRHTLTQVSIPLVVITGMILLADFGTAVVLASTAMAVLFVCGLSTRYLLIAALASLAVLGAATVHKPYRLLRVISYVDPGFQYTQRTALGQKILEYAKSGSKVQDTSYHGLQSRIAVATGGIAGLGLMNSQQKRMFLPEPHTDYLFAVLCEETGLIGGIIVLAGFLVLIWRGYRLYWMALDDFGRYLAVGITTCIALQAFMNMSVVLDMGPAKGFPLPLMSYGGSSLVTTMIMFGLLLSISDRSVPPEEAQG